MSDFYSEAFAVALDDPDDGRIPGGNAVSFETAAKVLDRITPEERCAAIYVDWLMQLHRPGGQAQIQIRDLLLGQGAMDAHYLAELAQNADDAGASELLVHQENGWLLVANDGRSLSALNLLGLCRFFVHSDGKVVGLTPETIGRFGIGFKACHRIADEVLVATWRHVPKMRFGFRLPIANSRGPHSTPDQQLLSSLTSRWKKIGKFESQLRPSHELGHCTPEFHQDPTAPLPASLKAVALEFEARSSQGTWFAMRLNVVGQGDTAERLNDPGKRAREINPLFLKHISKVSIQGHTIEKQRHRPERMDKLGLDVTPVTLQMKTPVDTGGRAEYGFHLAPTDPKAVWQLVLPTNSDRKLARIERDRTIVLGGGLYAFLPLSGLVWPHQLHLHLDLPPNLARSAWNSDQEQAVAMALADVSQRLGAWLAESQDLWHPQWQPSLIFGGVPHHAGPTQAASLFLNHFREQMKQRPLIRSIWGGTVAAEEALELLLEGGDPPKQAWFRMAGRLHDLGADLLPIVPTLDGIDVLDLPRMETERAAQLFERIAGKAVGTETAFWRDYLWCAFGCILQPTNRMNRQKFLENTLNRIPIERANGGNCTLEDLAATRGRCRLKDDWHELFQQVAEWTPPKSYLSETSLFGIPMKELLGNLSEAVPTPTSWPDVVAAIDKHRYDDLRLIWKETLPRCPQSLARKVVGGMPLFDRRNTREKLTDFWLLSSRVPSPLHHILKVSDRASELVHCIDTWGLRDAYVKAVNDRISQELEAKLQASWPSGTTPAHPEHFLPASSSLPNDLKEATLKVLTSFVRERLTGAIGSPARKTLLIGALPAHKIIEKLPSFVRAPAWCNTATLKDFIEPMRQELGLSNTTIITADGLTREEKDSLGKQILSDFPSWKDFACDEGTLLELEDYLRNATGNWDLRTAPSVFRRLNEFVSIPDTEDPLDCDDPLQLVLLGNNASFNDTRKLPMPLGRIERVRRAATGLERFVSSSAEDDDLEPSESQPVHLQNDPWFDRLLEVLPEPRFFTAPPCGRLEWAFGEAKIVVTNPAYALGKDHKGPFVIIYGEGDRRPEEDGSKYEAILYHYSALAPEDAKVRRLLKTKRNLARFYRENRERIVNRLREVHASDLGYHAKHVLRELLQNAETAYGTREPGLATGERNFKVSIFPVDQGAAFRIQVRHLGRAFNQPLPNGHQIDDIARITAVSSEHFNEVPGWRGRFNKGFKSLFQVTNGVKVTSGPYSFEIRDLMLLDPPEPRPNPELNERPTTFEFEVPVRFRREFLSERGRKPVECLAFTAASLVFLRKIDAVEITEGDRTLLAYNLRRSPADVLKAWEVLLVRAADGEDSKFLTRQVESDQGKVGIAVPLQEGMRPAALPPAQRFLYRTFPLAQPVDFLPFLVEADFDTDQGRLGLREFDQSGELVCAALVAVFELLKQAIESFGKDEDFWLRWVEWMELPRLPAAGQLFPKIASELRQEIAKTKTWLLGHIPFKGELVSIVEVALPGPLLFRLAAKGDDYAPLLGDKSRWLGEDLATLLRREFEAGSNGVEVLRLDDEVARRVNSGACPEKLASLVQMALDEKIAENPFEENELRRALRVLQPVQPFAPPSPVEEPIASESISLDELLDQWDPEQALQEFTTAGDLGELVLPGRSSETEIAARLRKPRTLEGKAAWYRLLCLGCSFGARLGRAPRDRVIRLWSERLGDEFWEKTIPDSIEAAANSGFNRDLDQFFERIIHRLFKDGEARGEEAEFWRRVFYDFRKMHHFVFRNHLPETIVEYTSFPQADGPGLIKFLKTGEIQDDFRDPNEPRFTGVIGQSMSTPLFFVMRELARLGTIDDRFHRACYYMNAPARRVASRLGWIADDGLSVPSFVSLIDFSGTVHDHFEEKAPELLGYFDLPLHQFT